MSKTSVPKKWWWIGLAGLVVSAVVPFVGNLMRTDDRPRCALDGQLIDPTYQVQIDVADQPSFHFCCLLCAELWLDRSLDDLPRQIKVVDEVSGEMLDEQHAFFVYSSVFNNSPTGDRRHVFQNRQDAEKHAATYRGRLLEGDERPFAR